MSQYSMGADDVGCVHCPQLQLDLVTGARLHVFEQKVEPAAARLRPFRIPHRNIAEAEQLRMFDQAVPEPAFAYLPVMAQTHEFRHHQLNIRHSAKIVTQVRGSGLICRRWR